MTNSVDPDQTAPIGADGSVSTLFASILKIVSNFRQLFAADNSADIFFQMHFSWRFKGKTHCEKAIKCSAASHFISSPQTCLINSLIKEHESRLGYIVI